MNTIDTIQAKIPEQDEEIQIKFQRQEQHFETQAALLATLRAFFARHRDAFAPFQWTCYAWYNEIRFDANDWREQNPKNIARAFGAQLGQGTGRRETRHRKRRTDQAQAGGGGEAVSMNVTDFKIGMRVAYVPGAINDVAERGTVTSTNERLVFVKFDKHVEKFGWEGTTAEVRFPYDLVKLEEAT